MEKLIRYRDGGTVLTADKKDIVTECNEICFVNVGDWPFYVYRNDSNVKRLVPPGVEQSFGESALPGSIENDKFTVEFDTVNVGTTKGCGIERVYYRTEEKSSEC